MPGSLLLTLRRTTDLLPEFRIPLDSGDSQDKALATGDNILIALAYHTVDDSRTTRHSEHSTADIVLNK